MHEKKNNKKKGKGKIQYIEKKNRPFDADLKLIVFDLNKTLIKKRKEEDISIPELKMNKKLGGKFVYKRPYLSLLQKFLSLHKKV